MNRSGTDGDSSRAQRRAASGRHPERKPIARNARLPDLVVISGRNTTKPPGAARPPGARSPRVRHAARSPRVSSRSRLAGQGATWRARGGKSVDPRARRTAGPPVLRSDSSSPISPITRRVRRGTRRGTRNGAIRGDDVLRARGRRSRWIGVRAAGPSTRLRKSRIQGDPRYRAPTRGQPRTCSRSPRPHGVSCLCR